MFLIKFILIMFLAAIFIAGIFIYRIYASLHDGVKQFRRQMNGDNTQNNNNRKKRSATDDEAIYDTRKPEKANQKIFNKDEGEYVDFEEVK
jgi:Sec-independent protein translocase protein TatA